jgi:hypothetical protein
LTQGLLQVRRILAVGLIPIGGDAIINISGVRRSLEPIMSIIAVSFTLLVDLMAVPVKPEEAASPSRLLKADRASAITKGSLIGFATGLLSTTAAWAALPTAAALAIGAIFATASGFTWSVVGSAWGRLGLIRLYWWMTGRLLLRLMTFLADAHRRGILRQVGATYQFRHELLQARLAALAQLRRTPLTEQTAAHDA